MIITTFAMRSIDHLFGDEYSLFSFKFFMANINVSVVLFCVFLNFFEEINHFKKQPKAKQSSDYQYECYHYCGD